MDTFTIDAEAGAVSAELAKRGIASQTRVHVTVRVSEFEMASIAAAGLGFGWLADEPELYGDADLIASKR